MPEQASSLTPAGWIFLGLVWMVVISMVVFCFRRILKSRR
jgi:hypothetical protein